MKREYIVTALFFLVSAVFFYLFYELMIPFFTPVAWAAILVIVFYPIYIRMHAKVKSAGWSSLLICLLIFLIIIGPSVYILASLADETSDAVRQLNDFYREGKFDKITSLDLPFINSIKDRLQDYPELANIDLKTIIQDAVIKFTKAIGSQATNVIANITMTLFYFFLMMFAMFYFFRDGEKIIVFLKRITPLPTEQVGLLYSHLHGVIQAMMYGGVVIALVQGGLCGLLFFLVGIPSPVMWGTVMTILAFVPVLGPYLIYIPAGLILILSGSIVKGIVILIVGTFISQVDNVLRPFLFQGKSKTHTLMLFLSILGGIAMFGLLGIVLGPFIAAMFFTLLKMFELLLHPEETEISLGSNDLNP